MLRIYCSFSVVGCKGPFTPRMITILVSTLTDDNIQFIPEHVSVVVIFPP